MAQPKQTAGKEPARQRRAELYEAIGRNELTIQDAVKQMRKISQLTQAEFAEHRGVSAKVIKEIERGLANPTVNTLNRIGQFFGLEVAFVRRAKSGMQKGTTSPAEDNGMEMTTPEPAPALEEVIRLAVNQAVEAALKRMEIGALPVVGDTLQDHKKT